MVEEHPVLHCASKKICASTATRGIGHADVPRSSAPAVLFSEVMYPARRRITREQFGNSFR